ncbi:MAG: hypothetical protein ACLP1X_07160 [Polyangiaceae bacterium]
MTTLDELRIHGVEIVSVADGFDLNDPHAEVIIAVMAWAAKMDTGGDGHSKSSERSKYRASHFRSAMCSARHSSRDDSIVRHGVTAGIR